MRKNEIDEFNKNVEILPMYTSTYHNYLYYETIISFKTDNSNLVSFEVKRAYKMPTMEYGFYMTIGESNIPVLLSTDQVDKFMKTPFKAELFALDMQRERKRYESAHWCALFYWQKFSLVVS